VSCLPPAPSLAAAAEAARRAVDELLGGPVSGGGHARALRPEEAAAALWGRAPWHGAGEAVEVPALDAPPRGPPGAPATPEDLRWTLPGMAAGRRALPVAAFVPSAHGLRAPRAAYPQASRIRSTAEIAAAGAGAPRAVLHIALADVGSGGAALVERLAPFTCVEVLVLRGCGIERLDTLVLPGLVSCDLSGNRLGDVDALVRFLEASPHLTELDVRGNPPACDAAAGRLVAAACELRYLNGRAVPLEEHVRAVAASRAKNVAEQVARLQVRLFDAALAERAPALVAAAAWDPSGVVELDLAGARLPRVYVGGFTGLRSLNVARNALEDIASWGAHACAALTVVDASGNRIASLEALEALRHLAALRVLSLVGNGVAGAPEYRSRVIAATRWGCGTPAAAGLQVLDGVDVTPEEREAAPRALRQKPDAAAEVSWHLALEGCFGRDVAYAVASSEPSLRAQCADRIARAGVLVSPGGGGGGGGAAGGGGCWPLPTVNVTPLTALQVLWLPGRDLRDVIGLSALKCLRSLDLRCNARLKPKALLGDLAGLTTLEQVALLPAPIGDRGDAAAYVRSVVAALLPANRRLYLLEYAPIEVDALVEGFKAGADPKARPRALSLPLQRISAARAPACCVTSISCICICMCICALTVAGLLWCGLAFQWFHGLCLLLVERLPQSAQDMALYRWHLSLADTSPRMDHSYHAGDLPRHVLPDLLDLGGITELRLPERGIEAIDVRPLRSLRVLGLRRNAISSICGAGLEALAPGLRVLDLRENLLGLKDAAALRSTAGVLAALTGLEYLGIGGNLDAKDRRQWVALAPDIRSPGAAPGHAPVINNPKALAALVRLLPALKGEGCALRYINDGGVSPDARMLAFGGSGAKAEGFRSALLVRFFLGGAPRGALQELDLSAQRIKHLGGALGGLVRLRALSLAGNALTGRALTEAGLGGLVSLTALDVSRNAVAGMKDLGRALSMPPRLSSAAVTGNRCFAVDMPLNRIALLAKMPGAHHRDFALKRLNGVPVVTEERISAVAGRVSACSATACACRSLRV
jgi:Leucine-rich repeat (LRR) protein